MNIIDIHLVHYTAALFALTLSPLTFAQTASDDGPASWRHALSTGAYYSVGDYGQADDATVHYIPFSYQLGIANWQFEIGAPYLRLAGSGDILFNAGGVVGRSEFDIARDSVAESGIGDVVLSATYQLPAFDANDFFFDIGVDVKIPTADESRSLGTGATDYGLKLDVYKLFGEITAFSTIEYKYRGRSSVFSDIESSFNLSLGFAYPINAAWSTGLIYDYRQAAVATFDDTHEVVPYVSWQQSQHWSWMSYLVKGFTEDSADVAVGVQATYSW
jgi:hypothetical protein